MLAAVPFLATLLPGARGHRADVIAIVGGSLAVCVGLAVSLAMGNSVVLRDLAERRLSFYFARPLGPGSLWLGKAAASLVTCFFCFAVIAVPAMLFARSAWDRRWLGGIQPLVAGLLAMTVFFFVSHAVATVARSRSPLLALDFLFAGAAAGALLFIIWPVILGHAIEVLQVMGIAVAVAVLLVLAIAPAYQLAQGRTDIRRSHAAFSRFVWPAVAVIVLATGAYVWWLTSVEPRDLDEILSVEQPPRGAAVMLIGVSQGRGDYHATFLLDRTTGEYQRLSTPPWWGIESSRDGKVLAWLQPSGVFSIRHLELYVRGRATGILVSPSSRFVLSDDGTRAATDDGRLVSVYDVATGRLLASAGGFDPSSHANLFFVTNDLLRVIETSPLRISELDVRARQLTRTGQQAIAVPWGPAISVSRDGSRMFVRGANLIVDGRTGGTLASIGTERYGMVRMLNDGSVAAISYTTGAPHLRLFGSDGKLVHNLPLGRDPTAWIIGEIEGGRLIVSLRGGIIYVVDLARGLIVRKLEDLRGPYPRDSIDPRLTLYGADQELVARRGKSLVAWRADGEPRPLLKSTT